MTDGDCIYGGEPWVMCRIVESWRCTPETNITSHVNYTSIINFKKMYLNQFKYLQSALKAGFHPSKCQFPPRGILHMLVSSVWVWSGLRVNERSIQQSQDSVGTHKSISPSLPSPSKMDLGRGWGFPPAFDPSKGDFRGPWLFRLPSGKVVFASTRYLGLGIQGHP